MSRQATCKHCGRQMDIRGLRMHQERCYYKQQQPKDQEPSKPKRKQRHDCECGEQADWRPLLASDERQAQGIALGYAEYCTRCEEMRK